MDDKDSAKVALQDFDMLLASIIPHKYFSRFLREKNPQMIPYLQMVHLCKLYQDDQEIIEEMKKEQQILSEKVGVDVSNQKQLSIYIRYSNEVDSLEENLEKRVEQAYLIARSNRLIFMPLEL